VSGTYRTTLSAFWQFCRNRLLHCAVRDRTVHLIIVWCPVCPLHVQTAQVALWFVHRLIYAQHSWYNAHTREANKSKPLFSGMVVIAVQTQGHRRNRCSRRLQQLTDALPWSYRVQANNGDTVQALYACARLHHGRAYTKCQWRCAHLCRSDEHDWQTGQATLRERLSFGFCK
jgi:hypothetical protein